MLVMCGNMFVWKGHLTIYMLTHTGEKPYRCNVWKNVCLERKTDTTPGQSYRDDDYMIRWWSWWWYNDNIYDIFGSEMVVNINSWSEGIICYDDDEIILVWWWYDDDIIMMI